MSLFYIKKYRVYVAIAAQSVALYLCRPHGKRFNQLRRFFTRATVRSAGATINVTGTIHSDTDIFIVNHQSMMDIFTLEEAIGNDVRFIGRTGIMDVWPTSRIVDRVGHITVDQKDRRAIIKLMKDVKDQKGKKVVIFPEGTRSQTGRIGHFEAGTKLLVERLGLKSQPIVIKNILSVYNESGKFAKSGVVEIEILPAVTVQEDWYEKVYSDMEIVLMSYQNEQNKKL